MSSRAKVCINFCPFLDGAFTGLLHEIIWRNAACLNYTTINHKIHNCIGGGVVAATLLCGISSLFADASADRLATYKANRLIPQEVKLEVGGEAENDITFTPASHSWSSGSAARISNLNALKDKFSGMTWDEIQNFAWKENWMPSEGAQDMAEFLAAIQSGEITSDLPELTPEMARELKMKGFREIYDQTMTPGIPFSFDGSEDFSGISIWEKNISMLSGVTGAQIAQLKNMLSCYGLENVKWSGNEDISGVLMSGMNIGSWLPPSVAATGKYSECTLQIAFTGEEDLSKASFEKCNLTKSTGLTSDQFFQVSNWQEAKLPEVAFSGTEDFSRITSLYGTDLSRCTGITASQLLSGCQNLSGASLPSIAFTGKEDFSGKWIGGVDFSKCTGITAEQILQTQTSYPAEFSWEGVKLSKSQYEAMKDKLAAPLPFGTTYRIYVDGKLTKIDSPLGGEDARV